VTPDAKDTVSVDKTIELAEQLGLRYVVFGYISKGQRETIAQCQRIADATNVAAEKASQAGLKMCYHNHSFEFAKLEGSDKTGFDVFTERFDPKLVSFELDVFWAKIGGLDPLETMRRLGTRISQVHLKDLKAETGIITDEGKVPHPAFKELGAGTIDIPAVIKLAKEIGVAQCHVEQDQSPAPIESIMQSIEFLKRNA
jgi:sugar phosphate isomerase/epimerase